MTEAVPKYITSPSGRAALSSRDASRAMGSELCIATAAAGSVRIDAVMTRARAPLNSRLAVNVLLCSFFICTSTPFRVFLHRKPLLHILPAEDILHMYHFTSSVKYRQ